MKCTGQIRRPFVVLSDAEIILHEMFLDVKFKKIVKLCNNGPLEANFEWGKVIFIILILQQSSK